MSDIAIPLQPLTVPPATCLPSTLQDLVNVLAECLQVPLPDGYTQIVVSSNTPAPADQGKIWLKLDGSGNPIAFYKYAGGAWVPVAPQIVFWAVDGGTVNALSIGVTNYPNATLSSGLFIVQASNTITGATTLAVNSFPAKAVKIAGADPYSGAILDGHWYIFSYNPGSSTFELLNPSPAALSLPLSKVYDSGEIAIGGAGTVGTPLVHDLGERPKLVSAFFRCMTADVGVNPGQDIPSENFLWSWTDSANNSSGPVLRIESNGISLTPVWVWNGSSSEILLKTISSSSWTVIDPGKWKVIIRAFA